MYRNTTPATPAGWVRVRVRVSVSVRVRVGCILGACVAGVVFLYTGIYGLAWKRKQPYRTCRRNHFPVMGR